MLSFSRCAAAPEPGSITAELVTVAMSLRNGTFAGRCGGSHTFSFKPQDFALSSPRGSAAEAKVNEVEYRVLMQLLGG